MSSAGTALDLELVIDRTFNAPRDLVFEVWTHPKHLVNWWGRNDFTLPHCAMDFRVGGSYRFCMRSPDGEDHWVSGEYRRIIEPELIEKTWIRENAAGSVWCDTVLRLTFEELAGQTKFRLHQTGFETREPRDQHEGGWSQCLDRLSAYVQA